MAADRSSQSAAGRPRAVPIDLAAIVAVTLLLNVAVFAPVVRETSIRIPLGFLFVFFVPGYALVASLYPAADRSDSRSGSPASAGANGSLRSGPWGRRIDGLERLVLSFGLSVAVVPGIALLLNFTSWGIRTASVLAAATGFTLILTAVAAVRRRRAPAAERFRVPVRETAAALRAELVSPSDRAEVALTVLLVASVALAAASVGYGITTPGDGEQFSEVYLLTETDDGELVADGYPTAFERGESRELVLGIDNEEHRTVEYTAVAVEQEVESDDGEAVVTDQREIDRFETRLDHGETWTQPHDVEPTIVGEDVRIVWLVYLDGDVPAEPSTENAAYHVHLWIDVEDSSDG